MDYTCIYCKQKKNETEFNREHVVPRMMGTYIDGWMDGFCQIIKCANSAIPFLAKKLKIK